MKTACPARSKRPGRAGAGTLLELLFVLALLGFVVAGAWLAPGALDGRVGRIGGGLLGLGAFLITALFCGGLAAFGVEGVPRLPRCREGTCRGEDYRLQKANGTFHWVCRHGGHYARRGRRFVVVTDDGREVPHLIWRPFRGWFPDQPASPPYS